MSTVESFEAYRHLLFSIAYRMLGSAMEAEDVVQEAWLRYQSVRADSIQSLKAFLTTIITRLCINTLQTARAQREQYIGPWLPEPIATGENTLVTASEQSVLAESLSMAFMVLLETLTPTERAVFLLREVFDYEYAEIAEIVGQEETACRQQFSRAKKHIADNRPRFKPTKEQHRRVLDQFIRAVGEGEMGGLMNLLTEDVTMWADGGGKARGAATRPLHGAETVARFVIASTRLPQQPFHAEVVELNGESAVVIRSAERAIVALFIEVDRDQVREVRAIGNPDKLLRV
jgi:RNA polymerase sigma-70 factor (ECF subfamily)